jgi:DNA repair exonuclease SbcCD nuclease subunit
MTDQHFDTSSRWVETLRIARWCEAKCRELKADIIALGGDIFERRPNPLEMRAVCEHVQALANIAPVVACRGNHDVEDAIAPFNLLDAKHLIHADEQPNLVQITTVSGDVQVMLLPWPKRAHLLANAGNVGREVAGQVGQEALSNILRGFGAQRLQNLPAVFVGHVQLGGSKVSTGQPLAPGADFELTLPDLALAQADAYLLGHIHLPQTWEIDGAPALYGGSTRRTAYGELEQKYLTTVDISAGCFTTVVRHVIPTTPMVLLEWRDTEQSFPVSASSIPIGAEVRLRYHTRRERREVSRAEAQQLHDDLLAFGASVVKLDEVVEPETRSRSTVLGTITNPREKLEAFWAARQFEPGARREPLLQKFNEVHS